MIDLAGLAALDAVAVHGSIVAAAEALGFTPSAVSQQVKRLERQTGVPLLERVGRGVVLTAHGRHLVDGGSRIRAELERLEAGVHAQAGAVAGQLRVAAFSTAMRGLVAPVVRELRDAHPQLTLALAEREPWDATEFVATGQVDVALVHTWGDEALLHPDHLTATRIGTDLADVIVHAEHPLASRAWVTPGDLVDEAWIATPEGTICRRWLHRMHAGTGRVPHVAHESMEYESHFALVRAGLGIALVPRLGRAPLGPELAAVPAEDPAPTRELHALHRTSMGASPAVAVVVAALREHARGTMAGVAA